MRFVGVGKELTAGEFGVMGVGYFSALVTSKLPGILNEF